MNRIRCFVLEKTGRSKYRLRRYADGATTGSCPHGYHNAMGPSVGETLDDPTSHYFCTNTPRIDDTDPRWPAKCDHCDYLFESTDRFQVWGDAVYRNPTTGEELAWEDAPVGALRRLECYEDWMFGTDGQSWQCKLPGGHDWLIDGHANNCTRPNEKHNCWVREGIAPDFNIGKGGNTCSAGAGSISVPGYHGFLRNGYLEEC